jgi:hypothetical protein
MTKLILPQLTAFQRIALTPKTANNPLDDLFSVLCPFVENRVCIRVLL